VEQDRATVKCEAACRHYPGTRYIRMGTMIALEQPWTVGRRGAKVVRRAATCGDVDGTVAAARMTLTKALTNHGALIVTRITLASPACGTLIY
jgi:hypothetical protein